MSKQSGCLGILGEIIKNLLGLNSGDETIYPYQRQKFLLTNAERSFYGVLLQATSPEYTIFSKVRLADIIHVQKGTEKRQTYFNKIQAKHLDFVGCDPATMEILFAVELDDSSHAQAKRVERDAFVEGALRAAKIPLVRIPAKRNYAVEHITEQIQSAVTLYRHPRK